MLLLWLVTIINIITIIIVINTPTIISTITIHITLTLLHPNIPLYVLRNICYLNSSFQQMELKLTVPYIMMLNSRSKNISAQLRSYDLPSHRRIDTLKLKLGAFAQTRGGTTENTRTKTIKSRSCQQIRRKDGEDSIDFLNAKISFSGSHRRLRQRFFWTSDNTWTVIKDNLKARMGPDNSRFLHRFRCLAKYSYTIHGPFFYSVALADSKIM